MSPANKRVGDCKSSTESSILSRASIFLNRNEGVFGKNLPRGKSRSLLPNDGEVNISIASSYNTTPIKVSLEFKKSHTNLTYTYKGHKNTDRITGDSSTITGEDIKDFVQKFIRSIDGDPTISELFSEYLENGSAHIDTRKKNISNTLDYLKREGIDQDQETISYFSTTDEKGLSIPERWQEKYDLPHKLRQVKSIFGRKNLLVYKRKGWDVKKFGNFVSFIPETTISQPFSTSDNEVDHIISFFQKAKEEHPVFYDIYLLAFGAGLRQSEIYQIKYEDFTTFSGQHFLLLPFATKRTKIRKQTGVTEKAPLSHQVYKHFTSRGLSGPVIVGGKRLHKRFVKFLKQEVGITENKAAHRLRKILGARLATEHGIYHAAKQLRNSVQVAERYYSDLTKHKNELAV